VLKLNTMIILENESLVAKINPKGAELESLVNKQTGLQYMWSGDPAFWPKHSPVLFPVVGGLKDNTYYYDGKPYQLTRHGFGRDKTYVVEQASAIEVVCTLTQDEQSLSVYPFAFVFKVWYRLTGSEISCTFEVENPAESPLLFSAGGHPAFAVPLTGNTTYDDYYLKFNHTETIQRNKLVNGLTGNNYEVLPMEGNVLRLHKSLFYEDAIVIKGMQSNMITLASSKHQHGIHFKFIDFPFFGIWAAKDANFVCLEPWCGVTDGEDHDQQLQHKEGIVTLAAHAHWERTWSAECF
jgi:galactose mutarotase-like enzyme